MLGQVVDAHEQACAGRHRESRRHGSHDNAPIR
jgi:hypothetical protein